jgi:hypothetical protein
LNNKIFVCTSAYNDTDLFITLETAYSNASNPQNVYFGIGMQYPDIPKPDLSSYKNVRTIDIPEVHPIGTSPSRAIAAGLLEDEHYFLSIDAHTIFKKDWDKNLIKYFSELKEKYKKPVISTYSPYWYRDKDGFIFNQNQNQSFEEEMPQFKLKFKMDDEVFPEGYVMPTPTWDKEVTSKYEEHYLIGAHLLFAESSYLNEVPFDPYISYHEENTTAMRAWTRGYRIFAIDKDILWTREMFHGPSDSESWRHKTERKNLDGFNYLDKIAIGALRCKDILLGEILGIYGSPSIELLKEYERYAGVDHVDIYKKIYERVEASSKTNTPSRAMYNFDKARNA